MQDQDQDLALRAVACKGWRWMPGMLAAPKDAGITLRAVPVRIIQAYKIGGQLVAGLMGPEDEDCAGLWEEYRDQRLPDLRDPATRGCLLELAREAWDDPGLHIQGQYHEGQWRWRFRGGKHHGGTFNRAADVWHDTEEAALVAALEAAGRRG